LLGFAEHVWEDITEERGGGWSSWEEYFGTAGLVRMDLEE
jgi:hypothetical protein